MSRVAFQLPDTVFERLQKLAVRTGRSETEYMIEAIREYLDDLEDLHLVEQRLKDIHEGKSQTVPLEIMKCHVCGGYLEPTISDLPFCLGPTNIVVIKKLPVLECTNCTEFSIEDSVMEKVENLLAQTAEAAELEVIAYAA